MIKKKGSVVPRYLARASKRHGQHLIKFGVDVKIEGRKITALDTGNTIEIRSNVFYRGKNKSTISVSVKDIWLEGVKPK